MCHGGWDVADAMVACRQLGFPAEGELGCADAASTKPSYITCTGAIHCSSSCFGKNTQSMGIWNMRCTGNEINLTECRGKDNNKCIEDAGMIRSKCNSHMYST